MTTPHTLNLRISIDQEDIPDHILDGLSSELESQLRELPVASVSQATEVVHIEGGKSTTMLIAGAFLLQVVPIALPEVLNFLKAWTLRGEAKTVRIKKSNGENLVEADFPADMPPERVKEYLDLL